MSEKGSKWLGASRVKAKLVLFASLMVVGCLHSQERAACSSVALASIEANYVDEVLKACEGQSFDACTARKDIEARYADRREEWIQCH